MPKVFQIHRSPDQTGFTLIEVLVAIAIVAILATIGLVSYGGIQKQARDAKRKAEVAAIAKAIEQTYVSGNYSGIDNTKFTSGAVPQDPQNVAPYQYSYVINNGAVSTTAPTTATTNITSFVVCADLENGSGGNASGTSGSYAAGGAFYCMKNQQ